MIAKWKKLPSELMQVNASHWKRTGVVQVEVSGVKLVTTIRVPSDTKDVTAFLQASEELKAKVVKAQATATEFELTAVELK